MSTPKWTSLGSCVKVAALVQVLVAAGFGCSRKDGAALPTSGNAESRVGVRTVRAQTDAGALLRATGELRARNEAVLSAETSGRILRFKADVGSRVKKGEVLVELNDATARIQLLQAQASRALADAAHKSAVSDLKRTQELAKGNASTPALLEKAVIGEEQTAAALQQANAAVAAAEDLLSKHYMRAPFDGVVTARMKSAGEFVAMTPPTAVISMVDVATVEVRALVPETVVDLVSVGAELEATVSPSGKPFKAKVRAIGASVDATTRTVDVRADIAGEPFAELRPGAIIQLTLGAATTKKGLYLPADVVQGTAGALGSPRYVWVVVDEIVHKRDVAVEKMTPGTVRVTSGLNASDVVVAEGNVNLSDGAKVRVLQ